MNIAKTALKAIAKVDYAVHTPIARRIAINLMAGAVLGTIERYTTMLDDIDTDGNLTAGYYVKDTILSLATMVIANAACDSLDAILEKSDAERAKKLSRSYERP